MGHRKYTDEQIKQARKKYILGTAKYPEVSENEKPYAADPRTGFNIKMKREKKTTLGFFGYLKGVEPGLLAELEEPIAVCSFNYRYHKFNGVGALKYDPVSCSKVTDLNACQLLLSLRGNYRLRVKLKPLILPACIEIDKKVVAVPSVGCPKALQVEDILSHLLWANGARKRTTILVVHESEEKIYYQKLKNLLIKYGVGLVSWSCKEPVLGFAVSRLAAQQSASIIGTRRCAVLCDANVMHSKRIMDGYDSDVEKKFPVKSPSMRYTGAGLGTGVPLKQYDGGEFTPTKAAVGGMGRPIEQVVTISETTFYDPCFITSSEDADLTEEFLFEENLCRLRGQASKKTFVKNGLIEKLDINKFGFETNNYMQLRHDYLSSLNYEDNIPILYSKDKKLTPMTVGKLAYEIATTHRLDPVIIRSLIIEKILLQYKNQARHMK